MSSLNPLTWSLEQLSRWVDQALVQVASRLFRQVVFAPVRWSDAAGGLYRMNLTIALSALSLIAVWSLLRQMWPVSLYPKHPQLTLERIVTAAVLAVVALPVIHTLLELNNQIVLTFVSHVPTVNLVSASSLELSVNPLLALGLGALVLVLLIYLGFFYALRTVEIYVLAGLFPWFAILWASGTDDSWLNNIVRELMVAVFVQSVHAMTFWMFVQLTTHTSSLSDEFLDAGVLWYMTKIPDQLRRLLGASGQRGRLLPWM